ncbi:DUF2780 domain-containing protein [Vibrio zhugei]|uniref:DUF2780 domain-containing protein n=1 Tax=Vibrio zhugei TaxID=2479546 RepID=A0ABV7C8X9_9VIBR|nr:DUF2780 domain-containing protein [Vibrio zhugei]
MMKRSLVSVLAISATLISAPSHAFLNFGNSDDSITKTLNGALNQVKATSQLTSNISQQLDVKPKQAAGGAGALLALAQNKLGMQNKQELNQLVPGIDKLTNLNLGGSSKLGSNINSLSQVNAIFTKLGLDPAMISQFVPIVLQYLTQHNASNSLIDSLSGLWGSNS